jgi:3',5'-cyclic AMP phosphodiesterase CpdA
MTVPIRILQIGDTHWAREPIAPGIDSLARFDSLCDWISSIKDPIDFIMHTGDWVHRGQLANDSGHSTRCAWRRLSRLGIPILTAVGNHDHRHALRECLTESLPKDWKLHALDSDLERLAYWFTLANESFLVLDARASQQIDPRGEICPRQLAALEELLADTSRTWTVFMHYPPINLDCDWIDRTMLIENGEHLHALLASHANRIRGVFFGHIHRPVCCMKQSVLYASTGSATMHFPNLPGDAQALMQSDPIAFANYISISQLGALVKTQWTMLSK